MHCVAALYVAPIYVPFISYINLTHYTCMHLEWAVKQLKAVRSNLLVSPTSLVEMELFFVTIALFVGYSAVNGKTVYITS